MHTVAVPSMISTWFSILYQPPYATDNTMLTYSTWFVYISSSFFPVYNMIFGYIHNYHVLSVRDISKK